MLSSGLEPIEQRVSEKKKCPLLKHAPMSLTLLSGMLPLRLSAEAGFRSLASTAQPFLAAGKAKGPTPANPSATTWRGLKLDTRRPCSVDSLEFQ